MGEKFYKKEKFQGIFFPILYFLLTIAIVVTGCVIFYNKYYQPILVDGSSMMPTLVGGDYSKKTITIDGAQYPINYRSHYGIADLHKNAVNNLKRFDVCVTHYPASWTGSSDASIIKRVWGFPGETIELTYDSDNLSFTFSVEKGSYKYKVTAPVVEITRKYEAEYLVNNKRKFTTVSDTFTAARFKVANKTFYTNATAHRTFAKRTLANNEYFVMGDNWSGSSDSYTHLTSPDLLTKKYIEGKAVCIKGYATSLNNEAKFIHKTKERYNF